MTETLPILGKPVPITRMSDVHEGDWTTIELKLSQFPGPLNTAQGLSASQRSVLLMTDAIVIFRRIRFEGRWLTRSFMDLRNARFHWQADELLEPGYGTPERIASYYFHDAFHVQQYVDGDRDGDLNSMVNREVSATLAQLDLAAMLHADQSFLDYLRAYAANRTAIEDRLRTGVGLLGSILFGRPRYEDHFAVF